MSLGYIQTGAAFLPQGKVSTLASQNIKALDGWMSLATIGKILEEDTIPNEFVSSQRAFYWRGKAFHFLHFFKVTFLLDVIAFFCFPPTIFPQVFVCTRWATSSQGSIFSSLKHQQSEVFSFADVSLDSPLTLFTGDVAAPVVFAVAPLHHFVHVGVVASAAAHQVTAVTPIGGLVALPGGKETWWVSVKPSRAFWTNDDKLCNWTY